MSAAEVASTPTDWAAVISAIVTGVAAVTGIVVTSWQARSAQEAASRDLKQSLKVQTDIIEYRSLAADRRAIQAQKMKIYATFQGSVNDLIAGADRGRQQDSEFGKAHSTMLKAAAEVTLVAPKVIGDLADKVKDQLNTGIDRQGFRSDFHSGKLEPHLKALTAEMKSDLASYQTPVPAAAPEDPERAETVAGKAERWISARATHWIRRA
jgi:hypothetical protein